MEKLPHRYTATARASRDAGLLLESPGPQPIAAGPPRQFGGAGQCWSPETLLAAALAGCFVLTFRATARASSFPYLSLECRAEGLLDRAEGALRFIEFALQATLTVAPGGDRQRAARLLEKAAGGCLVANSLRCPARLNPLVIEASPETVEAAR